MAETPKKPGAPAAAKTPANAAQPKEAASPYQLSYGEVLKLQIGKDEKAAHVSKFGDYTFVQVKFSPEMQVFDKDGKKVDDFKPISEMSEQVMLANNMGKYYLSLKPDQSGLNQTPEQFADPVHQEIARRLLIANGGQPISRSNLYDVFPTNFPHGATISYLNGKYIVFYNEKGDGCYSYGTQDSNGTSLPPNRWHRFNQSHNIPAELSVFIQRNAEFARQNVKIINNQFGVKTEDDKITFYDISGPNIQIRHIPEIFSDRVGTVKKNVCVDSQKSDVFYYCRSEGQVHTIYKLHKDGGVWKSDQLKLPKSYDGISRLRMDPSGNFFLLETGSGLATIAKDTMEEVNFYAHKKAHFDEAGRVYVTNNEGALQILEPKYDPILQVLARKQAAALLKGGRSSGQATPQAAAKAAQAEKHKALVPLKTELSLLFDERITEAKGLNDLMQIRVDMQTATDRLQQEGKTSEQITFITEDIDKAFQIQEKKLASVEVRTLLEGVRTKLADPNLSMIALAEVARDMAAVSGMQGIVVDELRKPIVEFTDYFNRRSFEVVSREKTSIEGQVQAVLDRVRTTLKKFQSKAEFDDWRNITYNQERAKLGFLANSIPVEISGDLHEKIMTARDELRRLAEEYEEKFTRQYATVREQAFVRTQMTSDAIHHDIESFLDRMRQKVFANRAAAEKEFEANPDYRAIQEEITLLSAKSADVAVALNRTLKVEKANFLYAVERGSFTKVAASGEQMERFGEHTFFPKWEGKTKEKKQSRVELAFFADEKSKGPGIAADKIQGDVGVLIANSRGETERVRLFEGREDEDEWRYGGMSYRGGAMPASYLAMKDFRELKKAYADWNKGPRSSLSQELQKKRDALHAHYATRPKKKAQRTGPAYAAHEAQYRALIADYQNFLQANPQIPLLQKLDQLMHAPPDANGNGRGYVPEWQNHWVLDQDTENYLEEMAKNLKMQLDLKSDILLLSGHAGTGKDVLVKMFCQRTHRPYFAIDCTKWTTEFELSEDVVLESVNGASQTLKVPSVVLNAITTPGAIMYFNEFNGMPEQAQIFLHALMDEKRSLTLKTSSGKTIKADPSVLLIASMNPDYPGTFKPQFATRSRMVTLPVSYPALNRPLDPNDPNKNPAYSPSEALRIARSVDSLAELTFDPNLDRNEFVRMWEKYVNGMQNGAPDPTATQKFDIDVIIALIQYAEKLREDFIAQFEQTSDARKALPVTQPLTLREMRRCAYYLSREVTPDNKAKSNPERMAKGLLAKFFLSHFDKQEDKEKIVHWLTTATSKKRVAA